MHAIRTIQASEKPAHVNAVIKSDPSYFYFSNPPARLKLGDILFTAFRGKIIAMGVVRAILSRHASVGRQAVCKLRSLA